MLIFLFIFGYFVKNIDKLYYLEKILKCLIVFYMIFFVFFLIYYFLIGKSDEL